MHARLTSAALFAAGWMVVAVALVSPLHEASEEIFSAHMIQHELLMVIAAPLLVLARPAGLVLCALPRRVRFGVAGWMRGRTVRALWARTTKPLDAWLIHAVAIWGWHIPGLFQAT